MRHSLVLVLRQIFCNPRAVAIGSTKVSGDAIILMKIEQVDEQLGVKMEEIRNWRRKIEGHIRYNKTAYLILLLEGVFIWLTPIVEFKYGALAWVTETSIRSFIISPSFPVPPLVPTALAAWFFDDWYLLSTYLTFLVISELLFKKKWSLNMDFVRMMIVIQMGVIYYMKWY